MERGCLPHPVAVEMERGTYPTLWQWNGKVYLTHLMSAKWEEILTHPVAVEWKEVLTHPVAVEWKEVLTHPVAVEW